MTVQELIDILLNVEDKSLPVTVDADHGQYPMKSTFAGETYVEDLEEYLMEEIHEDDLEDFPDAVKVFKISGY